jgi:hypothetical protein
VRQRDEFDRDAEPDTTATPPPMPAQDDLLGLQRWAGNRAVTSLLGERSGLENAADTVARQHAEPLAKEHGWFGRPGGLDTGTAQRAVGGHLGVDLSDVAIKPGRLVSAPSQAMASTLDEVVHVAPGAFDPATPIGQALLAHEFTHVVQQRAGAALPAGPGAAHADRARPVGRAPAGMAQHTIACNPSSQQSVATPTTFSEVVAAYAKSADPAVRAASLAQGIATARANAHRMYNESGKPPVSTLRQQYEAETGAQVDDNPLIGVSQDDVERAYRAWAENPGGSEPPWVLLALWVKEGIGAPKPEQEFPGGIPATSAADAKAIYRSRAYYVNFGADVYISHVATSGDNAADFVPGTGAGHDTVFHNEVARQVAAGRLPRNLEAEIDASLAVTPAGPGLFKVAPTPRFAELSLMLVDAFYREQKDALVADSRVGPNPDPGLVYMKWNMKAASFDDFLDRAPNPDPGGAVPSREEWAFHRPMPLNEYGEPRRNAMRFKYFLELFRHAYESKP